jgi:hypothetical protein
LAELPYSFAPNMILSKVEVNWNPKNAKSGSYNNSLTIKLFVITINTITTTIIIIIIRINAF